MLGTDEITSRWIKKGGGAMISRACVCDRDKIHMILERTYCLQLGIDEITFRWIKRGGGGYDFLSLCVCVIETQFIWFFLEKFLSCVRDRRNNVKREVMISPSQKMFFSWNKIWIIFFFQIRPISIVFVLRARGIFP